MRAVFKWLLRIVLVLALDEVEVAHRADLDGGEAVGDAALAEPKGLGAHARGADE